MIGDLRLEMEAIALPEMHLASKGHSFSGRNTAIEQTSRGEVCFDM